MEIGIKNSSRIISIGTAVPEFAVQQDTILEFMQDAYQEPVTSRKLNMLFQNSGIETRYSVLPDFLNNGHQVLYPDNKEKLFIEERIDIYKQKSIPLALNAIRICFRNIGTSPKDLKITHLITVTCTGIHSPGLDSILIEELNLSPDIFHTSLNFLGCNAAFPALKIADAIVKSDNKAKVLIVCVELCTLHFQPKNNSDNLLSNTIFGDGAAALLLVSEDSAISDSYSGLRLNNFFSTTLSHGKDLMGWNLTTINFEMILNSGIPGFLGKELEQLKEKILSKFKISLDEIQHWAIHPGGKKILDVVRQQLNLESYQIEPSYKVLKQYGNMSSPSVLFVLVEILKNINYGDTVFSMGFGPGISIEAALMTYENA